MDSLRRWDIRLVPTLVGELTGPRRRFRLVAAAFFSEQVRIRPGPGAACTTGTPITPSGSVRVTKGPGSRAAGVAMAAKLIKLAQARWGAVNAPHLVALVPAGARFESGQLVERPAESGGDQQAA